MSHRLLKRLPIGKVASLAIVCVTLLISCGGNDTQPYTEDEVSGIEEIIPTFDLEGLTFPYSEKNYRVQRTGEYIPLHLRFRDDENVEVPRQCHSGDNPIGISFENTLLADGWTLEMVRHAPDISTNRNYTSNYGLSAVFRKSTYVLSMECHFGTDTYDLKSVKADDSKGFYGDLELERTCSQSTYIALMLTRDSVPDGFVIGDKSDWKKTSIKEMRSVFLDDAWRINSTAPSQGVSATNTDYNGQVYPFGNQFPRTPDDTEHGPVRRCKR